MEKETVNLNSALLEGIIEAVQSETDKSVSVLCKTRRKRPDDTIGEVALWVSVPAPLVEKNGDKLVQGVGIRVVGALDTIGGSELVCIIAEHIEFQQGKVQ